jgi:DNA (cytosine-5)-methyltransferase 1
MLFLEYPKSTSRIIAAYVVWLPISRVFQHGGFEGCGNYSYRSTVGNAKGSGSARREREVRSTSLRQKRRRQLELIIKNDHQPSPVDTVGPSYRAVELFSGCGGLAYGFCQVGIYPEVMIEFNLGAIRTLEYNVAHGMFPVSDWCPLHSDVRDIDWSPFRGQIAVVAGGPPCQPFSIAGRHRGNTDDRDMWPEAIRAVRDVRPKAFLFENVRGLLRENFSNYFKNIIIALANAGDGYQVSHAKVNAADYGAAQQRHRVIVAGICRSMEPMLEFPVPSHSRERLLWDQWVTGDYWLNHDIAFPSNDETLTLLDKAVVMRLRREGVTPQTRPWRTVRDAIKGLGEPSGVRGHVLRNGAKAYQRHTGSPLDSPAKTLKAGTHGVPGGENMLRADDGAVRYFTIREAARLQGLPDNFEFPGTWSESMRQLGNAVPTELAAAFGSWLSASLNSDDQKSLTALTGD